MMVRVDGSPVPRVPPVVSGDAEHQAARRSEHTSQVAQHVVRRKNVFEHMVTDRHVYALIRHRMERFEDTQAGLDSLGAGRRVDLDPDTLSRLKRKEQLPAGASEIENRVARSDKLCELLPIEDPRECAIALDGARVARAALP
jgi:Holliday junction resolvasome RuvABC ATP-dependent DNA helicase subunit